MLVGVKPFTPKAAQGRMVSKCLLCWYMQVYLHTAPLCHIGGLSSAMTMLMVGGCHVLIPKFEPKSALEAIERHKVTSFITVPAIMAGLISLIRYTIIFVYFFLLLLFFFLDKKIGKLYIPMYLEQIFAEFSHVVCANQ